MYNPDSFALIARNSQVSCFRLHHSLWQPERIQGEEWHNYSLAELIKKLDDRINAEAHLAQIDVQIICDEAAQVQTPEAIVQLQKLGCTQWQILRWAPLVSAIIPVNGTVNIQDSETICTQILPLAQHATTWGAPDQSAQTSVPEDERAEMEALRVSARSLTQENMILRARLDVAAPLDVERLLSYLPALYVQVFSVIGAADLALLTGRVEPFNIPSPFPEPSAETLSCKQREFRQLGIEEQARIVRLVSNHAHRLSARPEMQALLRELDAEH